MLARLALAHLLVPFTALIACDGGAPSPSSEAGSSLPGAKADGPFARARPSCAEEPARAGIATPLLRDLDDPHTYYTLPTRWVIEDAAATYWLASSFQYFRPSEAAGYERYTFTTHLSLQVADSNARLLAALRVEDPAARVAPLPLSRSALAALELHLPAGSTVGRRATWDTASLTADLDLDLTRAGVEAATIFFGKRVGLGRVEAALTFVCDDGLGRTTRTVHPQAGASVVVGYDGVPVDYSAGTLADAADQVMVAAKWSTAYGYETRLPEAELAAIVRPLLRYDATFPAKDVQAIGRRVRTIVEAWAADELARGASQERIDRDLTTMRHKIDRLVGFAPEIRIYPVAAP